MSVLRPFVTIGSHHQGPHVDALYSLAERCGAQVLLVETRDGSAEAPVVALPRLSRRAAYAGQSRHEGANLRHGWSGGGI